MKASRFDSRFSLDEPHFDRNISIWYSSEFQKTETLLGWLSLSSFKTCDIWHFWNMNSYFQWNICQVKKRASAILVNKKGIKKTVLYNLRLDKVQNRWVAISVKVISFYLGFFSSTQRMEHTNSVQLPNFVVFRTCYFTSPKIAGERTSWIWQV